MYHGKRFALDGGQTASKNAASTFWCRWEADACVPSLGWYCEKEHPSLQRQWPSHSAECVPEIWQMSALLVATSLSHIHGNISNAPWTKHSFRTLLKTLVSQPSWRDSETKLAVFGGGQGTLVTRAGTVVMMSWHCGPISEERSEVLPQATLQKERVEGDELDVGRITLTC